MNTPNMLEAENVRTFLKDHPNGAIVDVLTPEQYAVQHIPGAKQACVFETVFLDHMKDVAPHHNTPVLLYGAGDSLDVEIAAEKLQEAGYTDVYIFPGGISAWRKAGYPLEGKAPEAEYPPYPPEIPLFKTYRLIPEKSRLAWVGRADNHQHWGTLGLKSGSLSFDGPNGTGRIVADMKAIHCDDLAGDPALHNQLFSHLSSEDFFLTRLFPEAAITITELRPKDLSKTNSGPGSKNPGSPAGTFAALPNYEGRGSVRIRNKEGMIDGEASLRNLDGNMLSLTGQIRLDRTRWGVLYGSARFFRFLGGHKVDDLISLDAMLMFEADGPENAV